MQYRIETWKVSELLSLYKDGNLFLNPPYQRKYIWTLEDQQTLIESIFKGQPFPNIFVFEKKKGVFDMVDGQQRTRTILGYVQGYFPSFDNEKYDEALHGNTVNNYKFPVIIIEEISQDESIEAFYTLVNKAGIHLNRPELKKAEFFDTNFLKLITELASLPGFKKLDLFSENSSNRMNDIDLVSELVTYLLEGYTDKKLKVDSTFKNDITTKQYQELKTRFVKVLGVLLKFNKEFAIKKTRYKQRNDIYTLFAFIDANITVGSANLLYIYKLLVRFKDAITPSNDHCIPFQEYAFHCISQSNSKDAREKRAQIFSDLFLNGKAQPNKTQQAVLKYYRAKPEISSMKKIGKHYTFNLAKLM